MSIFCTGLYKRNAPFHLPDDLEQNDTFIMRENKSKGRSVIEFGRELKQPIP
jgi:hypothetical protein